jgi:hypothetical protein
MTHNSRFFFEAEVSCRFRSGKFFLGQGMRPASRRDLCASPARSGKTSKIKLLGGEACAAGLSAPVV